MKISDKYMTNHATALTESRCLSIRSYVNLITASFHNPISAAPERSGAVFLCSPLYNIIKDRFDDKYPTTFAAGARVCETTKKNDLALSQGCETMKLNDLVFSELSLPRNQMIWPFRNFRYHEIKRFSPFGTSATTKSNVLVLSGTSATTKTNVLAISETPATTKTNDLAISETPATTKLNVLVLSETPATLPTNFFAITRTSATTEN